MFNDNGAGSTKIGIDVNFFSYEFVTPPDSDYVIMKYKFKNTNTTAISNFYSGLFADWDIGANGDLNKADYDSLNQLGYVYRTDNNPNTYVGITLLSAGSPTYWAIDNDNAVAGNPWGIYDGFTDAEKWQSLSSGIGRRQAGVTAGRDVAHVMGAGPFSIPAGGEITVAFALVAAHDLATLKLHAIAAKTKYNSTVSVNNYSNTVPTVYSLSQNYPNPFNPVTRIRFGLPERSNVSLRIYDMLGREISTLINGNLNAGSYETDWNGTNVSSGVYFYRLTTNNFTDTKRMILSK
jgi:hypothetical protein